MDDQQRRRIAESSGDSADIGIEQRHVQPSVESAMQARKDARSKTVAIRENVQVPRKVAHRGQKHQAFDLGAPRHRQRGGFGPKGMRNDRTRRDARPSSSAPKR